MLVVATLAVACGCRCTSTPTATDLKKLTLAELMNVDVLSVSVGWSEIPRSFDGRLSFTW